MDKVYEETFSQRRSHRETHEKLVCLLKQETHEKALNTINHHQNHSEVLFYTYPHSYDLKMRQ